MLFDCFFSRCSQFLCLLSKFPDWKFVIVVNIYWGLSDIFDCCRTFLFVSRIVWVLSIFLDCYHCLFAVTILSLVPTISDCCQNVLIKKILIVVNILPGCCQECLIVISFCLPGTFYAMLAKLSDCPRFFWWSKCRQCYQNFPVKKIEKVITQTENSYVWQFSRPESIFDILFR